jgi:hypothetical protein
MTGTGPHLTRRAVVLAFAAVAVTPFGLSRALGAASGVRVFRLDPVHRPGPGRSTSSCTGCTACRRHARNKLFANAKAAEVARAHKGCKCTVVRAGTIPAATYAALFGEPGNLERLSVDRRDTKVRTILRSRKKAAVVTPSTRRKIA